MKIAKKIFTALCTLAVVVCFMQITTVDAQAAPKSHTYVLDAKSGVGYPTAARASVNSRYETFQVYLPNEGDYVASVKTNSKNLMAKVTYKYAVTSDYYTSHSEYFGEAKFKGNNEITCFATKPGTYTVTITVKNAAKKTIATKKVKIYAGESEMFTKFTYANSDLMYTYSPSKNLTKKASGKLVVKAGKEYKIKKIQVGGYNPDGTINYKTVKSGSKITLSNVTAYAEQTYNYSSDWYESSTVESYDYIYPKTTIKITVYDKKLKTTYDVFRYVYKK